MNFHNNDNPITNIEDDILGFTSLAKRISNSITSSNINTRNSFTISIEGQWGAGKTSLVNLIKNEIKDEVIVLKFNPWMINDFEQLIKYFFSEFIKIVIKEIPWHKPYLKSKVIKSIKKMASFLTPDNIRMGTKNFSTTYKTKDLFFSEPTIYELKSEINAHLKQLNKRIVIIVDDIDRLTDKETETFFRLIKGIADFDNLIYLLLYDKAIVSKSLEQFKQENGEKYLDKIVQYSISIPKNYDSVLNKILFDKLDEILSNIQKYNFNKDKWSEIVPLLNKYIKNIRDINKVISVISFEYPQIAEDIEFTDFFIISLFKVHKYSLYEAIRDKQYKFFNTGHNHLIDEEKKEFEQKEKEYLENFLSQFSKYKPLFYELFPTLKDEEYYHWNHISIHQYKPIDSKHYFDNYFTFSVSDNKFSSQEYSELSKKLLLIDFREFEKAILSIDNIEKISLFLEMFKSIDENKIIEDIESSKNVIINLLTIHKKLPTSNSWFSSPSISYFNFAKDIFERIEKSQNILEAIYFKSNSLSLETKISFYQKMKKHYDFKTQFDEKTIDKIEEELKNNIKIIKLTDLLNKRKSINTIRSIYTLISSYKLLNMSNESLLEELNKQIFKSRDDFFNILNLFKSEVSVSGGKPFPHISNENMQEYTTLNIKEIEEYINKLDKNTFNQKELEIFNAWKIKNYI